MVLSTGNPEELFVTLPLADALPWVVKGSGKGEE